MNTTFKDPTNTSLEYALLDQKVAGAFNGKEYAYVSVPRTTGKAWGAGIAVENEPGYSPLDGPSLEWDKRADAVAFCQGMNGHLMLSDIRATEIIASSMRRDR